MASTVRVASTALVGSCRDVPPFEGVRLDLVVNLYHGTLTVLEWRVSEEMYYAHEDS